MCTIPQQAQPSSAPFHTALGSDFAWVLSAIL
jgi:hypothetical protein